MKIFHHTDLGMEGRSEGPVSKERNANTKLACWLLLTLFTVVLTVGSLFFTMAKKRFARFVSQAVPIERISIQYSF